MAEGKGRGAGPQLAPGRWATLVLVLAVVAGSGLVPRAFAQTAPDPTFWRNGRTDGGQANIRRVYQRWDTAFPNILYRLTTQQSVSVTPDNNAEWYWSDVYVCPWTSVTPSTAPFAQPRPTDCTKLHDGIGNTDPVETTTRSLDLTLTRTMIDNGGVVFLIYYEGVTSGDFGIAYTQWVPLTLVAPALTVSRSGTLALTEGGSAEAYTVQLAVVPAGDVTVRVSSADGGAVSVNQAGGDGRGAAGPDVHHDHLEHGADDHAGRGGGRRWER